MISTNIVLPVFNRLEHTEQTIKSLYDNTQDIFELVVVNDNSGKDTVNLLRQLQDKYHFLIINNDKNLGPGACRNKACNIIKERHKYLYFTDNDVFFTKNWLSELIKVYKIVSTKRVALLGGGCHPYLQNRHLIEANDKFNVGIKDAVSGYSHLLTWELWNRFGEFHTQEGLKKKTGRSDDWEYCQRIRLAGLLVGSVEPELVINTGKTDTYGDLAIGQETFKNINGIKIL